MIVSLADVWAQLHADDEETRVRARLLYGKRYPLVATATSEEVIGVIRRVSALQVERWLEEWYRVGRAAPKYAVEDWDG